MRISPYVVHVLVLAVLAVLLTMGMRPVTSCVFVEGVSVALLCATLFHGFFFDLTWVLIALFAPVLVCCGMWGLQLRLSGIVERLLCVCSVVALIALALLGAADVVSWQLYDAPLSIEVFIDVSQVGVWRLLKNGMYLYWHLLLALLIGCVGLGVLYVFAVRQVKRRCAENDNAHMIQLSAGRRWLAPVLVICALFGIGKALVACGYLHKEVTPIVHHGKMSQISYNVLQHICTSYQEKGSGGSLLFTSFLAGESLAEMADVAFPNRRHTPIYSDIDERITVTAQRSPLVQKKPRHVFLIVNESYSSWALSGTHGATHIADDFLELMREGQYWPQALESGRRTKPSLFSIVSGMQYIAEADNFYGGLPTAAPKIFKQLGYRCRLFYGGPPHLANKDILAESNGFDEYHAFGDVDHGVDGTMDWGVYDHKFYALVEGLLNDDMPSFNILMTVGTHVPFEIPVEEHGYNYDTVQYCDDFNPKVLRAREKIAHVWYANTYMTMFARKMCKRFPDTIIAMTGDHVMRGPPVKNMPQIYKYTVPIGFYGPDILKKSEAAHDEVVCHHDIIPTLVEMCADDGFRYPTVGNNLLTPGPKRRLTTGLGIICAEEGLLTEWSVSGGMRVLSPEGTTRRLSPEMTRLFRARQAVYWHRTRRGPTIRIGGALK